MVKLCAHHQKQFIRVLNTLYADEQLSLSENRSTSISKDQFFDLQNRESACPEKLNCSSGLKLNKSESQGPTTNKQYPVITKTETDCTNGADCPGIVAQYSSEILTVSTSSGDMSVGSCVTTANCTLYDLRSILFSKDQGNQCIEKAQCQPPRADGCTTKCVEMSKNDPHLSDMRESDCKSDDHNSLQSDHINCNFNHVTHLENSLLVYVQNSEAHSVSLPQSLVLNEDIQPSKLNWYSDKTPGLISDCHGQCDVDVSQPKSESPFENQKTMICSESAARKNTSDCCELPTVHTLVRNSSSTVQDERVATDLEQAPTILKPPVEAGTLIALPSLVHEEKKNNVHCAVPCHLNNGAKEHGSEIVKLACKEGTMIENAEVCLPVMENVHENRLTESTVSEWIDHACVGADLGRTPEPSVDTDSDVSLETKNMFTDCDTLTQDCEVCPLEKGTETFPRIVRDPNINPPVSPLMFPSNGIAAPGNVSHPKSQNLSPSRASHVQNSMEPEGTESISASSGNMHSHALPGGLSDMDIVTIQAKHMENPSISFHTSEETMDKKTIVVPEKPGHSCSVEAFRNKGSHNSGILTPFHKEFNITTALNNFDGISVSSAVKDDFNNLLLNYTKTDKDICMEIEKNTFLNEVKRLDDSFAMECEDSLDSNSSINEEKNCERVHSDYLRCGDIIKIKPKPKKKLKKTLTSTPSDRCLRSQLVQEASETVVLDHSTSYAQNLQIHVHNDLKRVVYIKGESNVTFATGADRDLIIDAVDCPDTCFDLSSSYMSTQDLQQSPERIVSCKSSTCTLPDVKIRVDINSEKRKVYIPVTKKKGPLNVENRNNFEDTKGTAVISSGARNSTKQRPSKSQPKRKGVPSNKRYLRKNKTNQLIQAESPMKTAAVKSKLKCTDKETERPKFIDWCSEEESQERISNFSNKYLSVHKNWIPLQKEGSIVHKSKNKSDRLKEIWKTKKRVRKNKNMVEGQKCSSIQMLFMNSLKLSDVCQWFLETTETKSLVIVKKLNTRLPEDLALPNFPLHKYPASSLYPHMLQAQRLKKHLKKFASVFPARNNRKTQNALSKLKHDKNVHLGEDQAFKDDGALRIKTFRGRKSKTSLNKPASDQILRKYNNIRAKFQHHSSSVNSKQRDTFTDTLECKASPNTKVTSYPNSANSHPPKADGHIKRGKGKKRSKDLAATSDVQPQKKRKSEKVDPGKKRFVGRTKKREQLHKRGSSVQSCIPKKQLTKRTLRRTPRNLVLRKRKAEEHEHLHKVQENKNIIAKRKQTSQRLAKSQTARKASQLREVEHKKSSSRTIKRKKVLTSQQNKTKQRSKTDSSPQRKRQSLEVK